MLVQFYINVSPIQAVYYCSDVMLWLSSSWFSSPQTAVLNVPNSAVDWLVIANNSLYTAIDFITQLVLVSLSVLNIQIFLN